MDRDRALGRIAAKTLGIVTREQVEQCGFSKSAISRRVVSGALSRVFPGVYALSPGACSFEQLAIAAAAWAGPEAVVSHRAAAFIHGLLDASPSKVELIVVRHLKKPRPDLTLHYNSLDDRDIRKWTGTRITSPHRTLFDVCAVSSSSQIEAMFEVAFRKGLVSPRKMIQELPRFDGPGHHGIPHLRRLLGSKAPSGSALELALVRLLSTSGIPLPERQVVVVHGSERVRLDFAYPALKLGIECDGWTYHCTINDWECDRRKWNLLTREGWTVLRFTWEDINRRPHYVKSLIRQEWAKRVPSLR